MEPFRRKLHAGLSLPMRLPLLLWLPQTVKRVLEDNGTEIRFLQQRFGDHIPSLPEVLQKKPFNQTIRRLFEHSIPSQDTYMIAGTGQMDADRFVPFVIPFEG